jgi:microcystin-dependent protein
VNVNGVIGVTGGEQTHALTVNEIPAHSHGSVYSQHASGTKDKAWYTTSGTSVAYGTVSAGGGQAHNNMPPYTQVSIWRRTG